MTVVQYELISEFKKFSQGQRFRRVSRYGDGYIYDEKIELLDDNSLGKSQTIEVKESDLNEKFTEVI